MIYFIMRFLCLAYPLASTSFIYTRRTVSLSEGLGCFPLPCNYIISKGLKFVNRFLRKNCTNFGIQPCRFLCKLPIDKNPNLWYNRRLGWLRRGVSASQPTNKKQGYIPLLNVWAESALKLFLNYPPTLL